MKSRRHRSGDAADPERAEIIALLCVRKTDGKKLSMNEIVKSVNAKRELLGLKEKNEGPLRRMIRELAPELGARTNKPKTTP